jgi:hypothetical protein
MCNNGLLKIALSCQCFYLDRKTLLIPISSLHTLPWLSDPLMKRATTTRATKRDMVDVDSTLTMHVRDFLLFIQNSNKDEICQCLWMFEALCRKSLLGISNMFCDFERDRFTIGSFSFWIRLPDFYLWNWPYLCLHFFSLFLCNSTRWNSCE